MRPVWRLILGRSVYSVGEYFRRFEAALRVSTCDGGRLREREVWRKTHNEVVCKFDLDFLYWLL